MVLVRQECACAAFRWWLKCVQYIYINKMFTRIFLLGFRRTEKHFFVGQELEELELGEERLPYLLDSLIINFFYVIGGMHKYFSGACFTVVFVFFFFFFLYQFFIRLKYKNVMLTNVYTFCL